MGFSYQQQDCMRFLYRMPIAHTKTLNDPTILCSHFCNVEPLSGEQNLDIIHFSDIFPQISSNTYALKSQGLYWAYLNTLASTLSEIRRT